MKSLKNLFSHQNKFSSEKSTADEKVKAAPVLKNESGRDITPHQHLFSGKHIDEKTILHVFSHIIAQEYGLKGKVGIVPVLYQNNTIFVDFKHSLWAQEVWTNRGRIIGQINDRLNRRIVYKIKAR